GEKTHADAAGEIAQALVQSVTNTHLRTLVADGAALAGVIQNQRDLEALRISLPPQIAEMVTKLEDARLADRKAEATAAQKAADARSAEQCTASVHRDFAHSQCNRK